EPVNGSLAPEPRPVRAPAASPWLVPVPPPAVTAKPNISALLQALRRRWRTALGLGIIWAAVAAGVVCLLPARYCPRCTVQLVAVPKLNVHAAHLKSRDVLRDTLDQPAVRDLDFVRRQPDTALAWLEDAINVECQEGSGLLTVSLNAECPEESVVLLNALAGS